MIRVREMDIEFYRHYFDSLEAARGPAWRYNESKPCGADFNNFFLARIYDTYHQMFRNYRREAEQVMESLALPPSATVLDMGCGTGAFAFHAAEHYRKVYAVDIAKAMLNRARRKARRAGRTNIEFRRGGFLSYEHADDPVDGVVSMVALHHLPDFWKSVGLQRLASLLQPGGRLYLLDVVFSFDMDRYESCLADFIQKMSIDMGPDGRAASEMHVREEYSTCHWIMEGLLQRAGFQIDDVNYTNEFLAGYLCTKKVHSATAASLTAATQPLR